MQLWCPRNEEKKIRFEPKQTETRSVSVVFCMVCFVKPKTKNFGLFRFVSVFLTFIVNNRKKQNCFETNGNNPKFSEKLQNMLSIKLFQVGILFVSVQSKHPNSLFWYRSKTFKTNYFETNPNKQKQP
jgi:hypothetical protein